MATSHVADSNNSRSLMYKTPRSPPIRRRRRVRSVRPALTSSTPNPRRRRRGQPGIPTDIGADSAGNDVHHRYRDPERTLIYDNPATYGTSADVVFGQGGSFTASGNNSGGLSASSQADPWSIAFDGPCNLYIVDYGNNRVLEYDQPPHTCVVATGTTGPTSSPPPPTPSPSPTPVGGGCTPSPVNPVPCTPTPSPTPTLCSPCLSPPAGTPQPTAAVGGVSELLVSGQGGSGPYGSGLAIALGAGVAAVLALVASAWYARRRSSAYYGDPPRNVGEGLRSPQTWSAQNKV